jgi:zinc protease
VRFTREYDTLNDSSASTSRSRRPTSRPRRSVRTDARLVQTTLSHAAAADADRRRSRRSRSLSAPRGPAAARLRGFVVQRSVLPQLNVKLLFAPGSAHDPKGKEGLAALAAEMIAEAGSKAHALDEIRKALFPMAGGFTAQVDKEMTTFTGRVHRDNWDAFAAVVLPMLTRPASARRTSRAEGAQKNALVQDLRANNEEELGKERLQAATSSPARPTRTRARHRRRLDAITLDDVKPSPRPPTRARPRGRALGRRARGARGRGSRARSRRCPREARRSRPKGVAAAPEGIEVDIIEKDTRATAISFGHPDRGHPRAPRLRGALRSRAPGSASTARRCRTSTSASARCAA